MRGRRRVARPPRRPAAGAGAGAGGGVEPEVSFWPFGGMILVAADFFLFGASALVAPWWAVGLLVLAWLAMFVQACAWWQPHPRRITVLAVAGMVGWFVVLVLGARLLGWSA